MKKLIHQQGDVLLYALKCLPVDAKGIDPGPRGFVLAEGEATGHAHRIEETEDVLLFEKAGTLYLCVIKAVELTHEEHGAQTLEPGFFEVGRVREVDPFTDEIRTIAD